MTLERGTLLHKRYRIIEILGQGGMGSVYRAVDENLGIDVALKENLFTTDEYARQFRLEAVILANLRHPNLPRVSDHFLVGDQGQYLVMDFIDGEDLRQRMERAGAISEEEAIMIGAALCDSLGYLHTRRPSILHRDLKPGNVKITPDGHIFLVDFGLAKVVQGSQATTTGARAMTPGYSPPEQYGTARTDPRTDIYSLGATLYAALTNSIPEDGLARAMDNAQLTPLRKRNNKISRRLAAAIETAMEIDPAERFQNPEEFKKALLSSKSKTQRLAGTYTVPPPPDTPDDSPIPKKPVEKKPGLMAVEPEHEFKPPKRKKKRRGGCVLPSLLIALLSLGALGVTFFSPNLVPAPVAGYIPWIQPTSTPQPTHTPATELPATETLASVQHTDIPGDLPEYTGLHLYDHHINTTLGSSEGDRFYHARLERPYNTDGVHIPYLDITDIWYYDADPKWFFAIIKVVGPDAKSALPRSYANGALPGKYALEVDLDLEGHGAWLFLVENPTSTEWTTEGVQVWRDGNGDVGGTDAIYPDTEGMDGDGYEVLVGNDPDAAWVRLSSQEPNSLEIAFKKSLFGEKFMVGAWAGTDDLDPSLFDLNDHFTHEQAGALNPEYTDFYPIKDVTEIDNTCRLAIGFEPASTVKGLCP